MEKAIKMKKWYLEGLDIFNKWVNVKDELTWGAFCCCSAVLTDYDRKHRNEMTQDLQEKAWFCGYLKGDCSEEALKDSGYFDENRLKYYKNFLKIS